MKRRLVACLVSNLLPYPFPGKALLCRAFSSLETKATIKIKKNQDNEDTAVGQNRGLLEAVSGFCCRFSLHGIRRYQYE